MILAPSLVCPHIFSIPRAGRSVETMPLARLHGLKHHCRDSARHDCHIIRLPNTAVKSSFASVMSSLNTKGSRA